MDKNTVKKTWNRLATVYDFVVTAEENSYNEVARHIIKSINYEDKILELATGVGNVALELCPHCRHIEASDISEEMIRKANMNKAHSKYQNIQFTLSDACNIDCEDGTYDVVILSNALHILPDPDKAMEEIKRILKPGGKLIAPNFVHKETLRSSVISTLITSVGYPTKRRFSEDDLLEYISSHDFKIRRTALFNGAVPLAYVEAVKDGEEYRAKITLK